MVWRSLQVEAKMRHLVDGSKTVCGRTVEAIVPAWTEPTDYCRSCAKRSGRKPINGIDVIQTVRVNGTPALKRALTNLNVPEWRIRLWLNNLEASSENVAAALEHGVGHAA